MCGWQEIVRPPAHDERTWTMWKRCVVKITSPSGFNSCDFESDIGIRPTAVRPVTASVGPHRARVLVCVLTSPN